MALGQVVQAARNAGFSGNDLVTAVAVALAESSGRPKATNTNTDGSKDYGLWQINSIHKGAGFDPDKAFDPEYNAQWAKKLHDERGWQPWVAYNSGAYEEHLDQARKAVHAARQSAATASGAEGWEATQVAHGTMPTTEAGVADALSAVVDADEFDPDSTLRTVLGSMSKLVKDGRANFDKGIGGLFGAIQGTDPDNPRAPTDDTTVTRMASTFDNEARMMQVAQQDAAATAETDEAAVTPAATGSSSGSLAWGGFDNGKIPLDKMHAIKGIHYSGEATHYFAPDAGTAMESMIAAAKRDGVTITLTDSYRDYATQVRLRKEKGHQVATADPGTSIHGFGKAIDVAGDAARKWIQRNGAEYGWVWPDWAQRQGKSYEPWHFEYRPSGKVA